MCGTGSGDSSRQFHDCRLPLFLFPLLPSVRSYLSPPVITQRLLLPLTGCEQRATSHPHFGAAAVTLLSPSIHGIKCILSQVLSSSPSCATNIPHMDFLGSLLLSRCNFLVQAEIRSVWLSQNAGSDWGRLSSDDL